MLRKMNSNTLKHFPKDLDLALVILFTLLCIQKPFFGKESFTKEIKKPFLGEKLYQKNCDSIFP